MQQHLGDGAGSPRGSAAIAAHCQLSADPLDDRRRPVPAAACRPRPHRPGRGDRPAEPVRRRRRAVRAAAGRRSTRSPGLARQSTPAAGAHRVLLARPPGAEPPGGHPDRPGVEAGAASRTPGAGTGRVCAARGQRRVRVAALGRDHGPVPASSARPSASAAAGSASIPASASISRASARVTSTRSAGPSPAQRLDRLLDLEGVADGPAERGVHPGQQRRGARPRARAPRRDHGLGQLPGRRRARA